jgi:hypothetical protein
MREKEKLFYIKFFLHFYDLSITMHWGIEKISFLHFLTLAFFPFFPEEILDEKNLSSVCHSPGD